MNFTLMNRKNKMKYIQTNPNKMNFRLVILFIYYHLVPELL